MSTESYRDPREVLARQKYFSLRPQPLEHWLWKQGIAPSAERVFWLHWQEGLRSRNWCSEIPLRRVAALCALDVSSVTRAYQLLSKLGLLRRQDPGRDPTRPFEQAIVITEVRIPRELVHELDRHPNRSREERQATRSDITPVSSVAPAVDEPIAQPPSRTAADPFRGLSGRERMRAISALLAKLSAGEQRQYHEALRTHQPHLTFDNDTQLSAEERGRVLQFLQIVAPLPRPSSTAASGSIQSGVASGPRRLTIFELARLRRDLHQCVGLELSPPLLREVVWSVEEGALRRFSTIHALCIALKKIREGGWSRPNRMPPNWSREIARLETCRSA